jgi:hypothetical protein
VHVQRGLFGLEKGDLEVRVWHVGDLDSKNSLATDVDCNICQLI